MHTSRLRYELTVIVIFLIWRINQANGDTHQCAAYDRKCDPRHQQPCCDTSFLCKLEGLRNDFFCGKKMVLGSSCDLDEDCGDIIHGKCSAEKKCVCRSNNIEKNETYCAPLLDGFCWKNETCATDNALCVDSECQCRDNYVRNEGHCLPVITGIRCQNDADYDITKSTVCAKNNTCVCLNNTAPISNILCLPLLDVYCETDKDCKVPNSICTHNECRCESKYAPLNRHNCKLVQLGMPCTNNTFCKSFMNHTICAENNTCIFDCDSYQVSTDGFASEIKINCRNHDDCTIENSKCIDTKCRCKPNYEFVESKCVPGILGQSCNKTYRSHNTTNTTGSEYSYLFFYFLGLDCKIDSDCIGIRNAECRNEKCKCKANFEKRDSLTCLPLLGSSCMTNEECFIKNSFCSDEQCQCIESYSQHFNDQCVTTYLTKACAVDDECYDIAFSYCSIKHQCACPRNFMAINGTKCGGLLGEYCSENISCWPKNSQCIRSHCQCKPFFMAKSYNQCLPIRLGELCERDTDCMKIQNSRCSIKGKCVCQRNYISLNATVCESLLGGHCTEDDECYIDNSVCIDNNCQCKTHYFAVELNTKCELSILGKKCLTRRDCLMVPNSECSSDNICVCRPHHFARSNYTCQPVLNAPCSIDNECFSGSFHCLDNVCQCKPNFTSISIDRCVETHKLYSCDDVSQCSDSWHWQCSFDGLCICNANNIDFTESVCLPILNGLCWKDDQCLTENSGCINFHCKCKPNFVGVADNHCMPIL